MRRSSLSVGALLGGLTTLPLMALFYLGDAFASLPFIPFVLFDWLARVLPGDLITLGIDGIVRLINILNLGDTSSAAKTIEQLMALALVLLGGIVLGTLIAAFLRGSRREGAQVGLLFAIVPLLISVLATLTVGSGGDPALSLLWISALWLGWGALLGNWLERPVAGTAPQSRGEGRREALARIAGGSLVVALVAWGAGRFLNGESTATGAGQPLARAPEAEAEPVSMPDGPATPFPEADSGTSEAILADRIEPAPGTRTELTPNEEFYRIDINARPPTIRREAWVLDVGGLVDNPQSLTLDDLMAYPAITQPVTMGCISNRVGGDLIGTSNWTGVRLRDLLEEWGVQDEARALYIEGADGFHEIVVREDMMDERTLLVYGMNGETLPVEHGFPLRIYIPNRYGMKQPKWITRIEAVSEWDEGYWVVRGWNQEARPQIVSVIDTIATDQPTVAGNIPVGGIAWAGDRGIRKVEVQVDDGEWQEAELRLPSLSPLTWVQWRYDWPATPGQHRLTVRATDGTGELQVVEEAPVRPDGATGYHSRTVTL